MVQDDLAKNFMNPHPGKIYNRPGGPDVYEDVKLVSTFMRSLCSCNFCMDVCDRVQRCQQMSMADMCCNAGLHWSSSDC